MTLKQADAIAGYERERQRSGGWAGIDTTAL